MSIKIIENIEGSQVPTSSTSNRRRSCGVETFRPPPSARGHRRLRQPSVIISGMIVLCVNARLAASFVMGASVVARRFGPWVGGAVGGLPVVAGPILLAYALAHGRALGGQAGAGALR